MKKGLRLGISCELNSREKNMNSREKDMNSREKDMNRRVKDKSRDRSISICACHFLIEFLSELILAMSGSIATD